MERPTGVFNTRYAEDIAIVRTKLQWCLLGGFIVLLVVLPLIMPDYILGIIITMGATIIAVQGLNILTGHCGQISLGQAAFMAVGAYTSAILAANFNLSFWLCLPIAGLTSALVGSIFGLPSLRVKGFYLALSTLAAHFIIMYVLLTPMEDITGGVSLGMQVPPATLGSIVFDTDRSAYYLVIFFTVIMSLFAKNITRTNTGRAFIAIRDNDIAASVMGISLFRYKVLAFFIGCFYAGIAGSLWAHYTMAIHADDFSLIRSFWYLGMLIIGGLGSTLGAVLGVVFVQVLDELVIVVSPAISAVFPAIGAQVFAALGQIVFALAIILFLVFEPRGLSHRWQIIKASYRLWPFSY